MDKKLNIIVPRKTNFADWYTSIINAAELILYSSIKGEVIFRPNAWAIWNNIQRYLDLEFNKIGVKNVALPSFIKYSEFIKEKQHVDGFAPEIFLVTKRGNEILTDPYVVRPTSEVLFCYYFKKILTSYNDLPIKLNQWCNVFRAEKTTRPFLRTSEFYWQELHSIHATKSEASVMAKKELDIYYHLVNDVLLIPVIKGEKSIGERFAGAENTYTIEALMQDGQALQCATAHYLGTNFAQTYDISFTNKNNKLVRPYQTSAGLSTRIIGATIMSHSDDYGLVLPFGIAPIQIKIIELNNKQDNKLNNAVNSIKNELIKSGYRVSVDDSDKSFGYKINECELKGVPLSIIIGPRDLANNSFILYRRDLRQKIEYQLKDLAHVIHKSIKEYQTNLYDKASKNLNLRTIKVTDFNDFKKQLAQGKLILAPWGGDISDEKQLKELTGATPRCIISKISNDITKCFFTHKIAKYWVYFGRAY